MGASPAVELMKKLINFIFAISLSLIIIVLAVTYAKFWTSYLIFGLGLFIHGVFLDWKPGWGTDGVEGSAQLYVSTLVVAFALFYAICYKPNSFTSVGFH